MRVTSLRTIAFSIASSLVWLACQSHGALTPNDGGGGSTTSSTTTAQTGGGGSGGATTSSSTSSVGGGGSGGSTTTTTSSTTSSSTTTTNNARLRIAAANLTSGSAQSYDPGHGLRILQGIRADLVLMQEMNFGTNSAAKLGQLVEQICGMDCEYTRGSGMIPNGIVSRHPILESGTWVDPKVTNRDFTWARIDVPGPTDLWAVSVHLLTSNATDRNAEAAALIGFLSANVPTTDYLVVGGDLNTDSRGEVALTTFSARLSVAAPYPADGDGNDNTSGPRSRPYDWNLVSAALRAKETPVVIGAASFANGLVVDTRVYTPISDLSPALVGDSGATGMQHMAVVRDFLLE
jgi:endonuclease/exonuclease/phosphatase family metal-dependent hydrolase